MITWHLPKCFPALPDDRVHIWRANLDLSPEQIERLETFLSPDETARAEKFRFARHRRRFTATRGILRQLLGNYLSVYPQDLSFSYGTKGKPYLNQTADYPLQFNLSHSHEYALFGFTQKHLIGVDLEYQRPMPDALKIARRFFSQQESQMLQKVETEQRSRLFFQLWTAKEAYLKAIGTGLSNSLASIEISRNRFDFLYLSKIEKDSSLVTDWSLYSCTPAENYAAAIAVQMLGANKDLDYWHWQDNLFKVID